MTMSRNLAHTFGNLLILVGLYLLLFTGGLLADQQYNVYAASGNTDVALSEVPAGKPFAPNPEAPAGAQPSFAVPPRFIAPSAPPVSTASTVSEPTDAASERIVSNTRSTITRIAIPGIKVDRKVVEVGWTVQQQDGKDVAIWDVDKYRVGHHTGSSNPGGGGNIVLSGHSGGTAYPFNDLYYLKPGDLVQLYSGNQLDDYVVSDHILLDEVGQPLEKRLENARYIEPTDEEVVTMVACWPLTGPDKFKQRIIIRAKPAGGTTEASRSVQDHDGWRAR